MTEVAKNRLTLYGCLVAIASLLVYGLYQTARENEMYDRMGERASHGFGNMAESKAIAEAEAIARSNEYKAWLAHLNEPDEAEKIRIVEAESEAQLAAARTREDKARYEAALMTRQLDIEEHQQKVKRGQLQAIKFWQQQVSNGMPGAEEYLKKALAATNTTK